MQFVSCAHKHTFWMKIVSTYLCQVCLMLTHLTQFQLPFFKRKKLKCLNNKYYDEPSTTKWLWKKRLTTDKKKGLFKRLYYFMSITSHEHSCNMHSKLFTNKSIALFLSTFLCVFCFACSFSNTAANIFTNFMTFVFTTCFLFWYLCKQKMKLKQI